MESFTSKETCSDTSASDHSPDSNVKIVSKKVKTTSKISDNVKNIRGSLKTNSIYTSEGTDKKLFPIFSLTTIKNGPDVASVEKTLEQINVIIPKKKRNRNLSKGNMEEISLFMNINTKDSSKRKRVKHKLKSERDMALNNLSMTDDSEEQAVNKTMPISAIDDEIKSIVTYLCSAVELQAEDHQLPINTLRETTYLDENSINEIKLSKFCNNMYDNKINCDKQTKTSKSKSIKTTCTLSERTEKVANVLNKRQSRRIKSNINGQICNENLVTEEKRHVSVLKLHQNTPPRAKSEQNTALIETLNEILSDETTDKDNIMARTKNEKDNLKLFPIFSSPKLSLDVSQNISKKGKSDDKKSVVECYITVSETDECLSSAMQLGHKDDCLPLKSVRGKSKAKTKNRKIKHNKNVSDNTIKVEIDGNVTPRRRSIRIKNNNFLSSEISDNVPQIAGKISTVKKCDLLIKESHLEQKVVLIDEVPQVTLLKTDNKCNSKLFPIFTSPKTRPNMYENESEEVSKEVDAEVMETVNCICSKVGDNLLLNSVDVNTNINETNNKNVSDITLKAEINENITPRILSKRKKSNNVLSNDISNNELKLAVKISSDTECDLLLEQEVLVDKVFQVATLGMNGKFNSKLFPIFTSPKSRQNMFEHKIEEESSEIDIEIMENVSSVCSNVYDNPLLISLDVDTSVNETNIIQKSPEDCLKTKSKKIKSNKKTKLKKSTSRKSATTPLQNSVTSTISSRRQSLRSRGIRHNLLDYNESDSVESPVKQATKISSDSTEEVTKIKKNLLKHESSGLLKVKFQTTKIGSKNVKDISNAFPIFSSPSLKSHVSKKRGCKRKAINVEDICVEVVKTLDSKKIPKTKKAKNPSYVKSKEQNDSEEDILIISNSSSNDSIVVLDKDTKDSITLAKKSDKQISGHQDTKKLVDTFCFPLFSNLEPIETVHFETYKFKICDEISDDICVPDWKEFSGLIDSEIIQMIKSDYQVHSNEDIFVEKDLVSDELWTDSSEKYIIKGNNESTISEIKSWLLQWKNRTSKKIGNGDDDYSCSDSNDDFIYNAIIITGVPGSGKTSLVFSLANELGFTVLEVNASSCRNGRNISNQLKEALESYHVESVKVEDRNINTFFKTINEDHTNKGKLSLVKDKISKGIKNFFDANEVGLLPKAGKITKQNNSIVNHFQVKERSNIQLKNKTRNLDNDKKDDLKNPLNDTSTESVSNNKNVCKISSLTIILFDDIDVVFEEDEGFWSTVKSFLKISKKPVILTVGRNLAIVKSMINSGIQVFNMKPSSEKAAVKKLKQICKNYARENTCTNLAFLTSQNDCDFRRNLLNAQFWTQVPQNRRNLDFKLNFFSSIPQHLKLINLNSFLSGDLQFSTSHIQQLLFNEVPDNFSNALLQYQSLGYDILYNNMFKILYSISSLEHQKFWPKSTVKFQESGLGVDNFSDSELWKEACELFERKKKALKNGSNSSELNVLADVLSDFSFTDTLKGLSCNTFHWKSISERVKMWTAGLPICFDHILGNNEDILNLISLVHIYRLRQLKNSALSENPNTADNEILNLNHQFHAEQSFEQKTERSINHLFSFLPPFSLLNRDALCLDYLSAIKIMCLNEEDRQLNSGKRSGRFLHYFDSISFYIDQKMF